MNATAIDVEPDAVFAQAASALLKEYAVKLKELADSVVTYENTRHLRLVGNDTAPAIRDELIERFKHLRPPVEELVHQSSAVLNEGNLRGLSRVELWLRLADLEHNLNTATRRIELIKPKK